ncbi:hypothetical protein Enr13x_25340 [Stieleria neptunia]|uniref:DUF2993 domain-containing protein n=1 Tax=Stieleria neptunia TaxID=2527979 RepID=A0A518HPB3_9BACT|nr:hypothetical protein [Stieleria neptunia]QDV42684.1 hypothetical protein Enr13x_25340 [Stieleria neptunia]
MWMRLIKRLLLVGALLVGSLGATAFWAHRETKKVPEFYERAIAAPPPQDVAESVEQLESDVQKLQDDVAQPGLWQARFAAEQINAWLIDQLPKRFPTLEAKGLQEPRVMIEDGLLMAAARFKDQRLDAVLSCELSVQLTDQPNRLAVSIKQIRAGALPLPLSQFKDRIKLIASKTNLNLQWETRDGESIALIDLPDQYPGHLDGSVIIESIELADQHLMVTGQTGDLQSSTFAPQGEIYKLAQLDDEPDSETLSDNGSPRDL